MCWVNERSRKRDCDRNITPNFIQIEWIDLSIYWIRSKERREKKRKRKKKQYYLKEFVAQWTRSLLIDAQCLTKMRSKRYFRSSFHYHRHLFIEFDLSIFKWYVTLSYFIFYSFKITCVILIHKRRTNENETLESIINFIWLRNVISFSKSIQCESVYLCVIFFYCFRFEYGVYMHNFCVSFLFRFILKSFISAVFTVVTASCLTFCVAAKKEHSQRSCRCLRWQFV